MAAPSGDQDPRLSSRVVETTSWGGPVDRPVPGSTGSFQRSAFCRRMAKARRPPSADTAASTSCPAPVVSADGGRLARSEEHTSELQSRLHLVCRLLLEKK